MIISSQNVRIFKDSYYGITTSLSTSGRPRRHVSLAIVPVEGRPRWSVLSIPGAGLSTRCTDLSVRDTLRPPPHRRGWRGRKLLSI